MIDLRSTLLILDSDTLSPELLETHFDAQTVTLFFIWDEALHKKRFFSPKREAFILQALETLEDLVVVHGNSREFVDWLRDNYPQSELFYASRFHDRFDEEMIPRIHGRYRVPKIKPIPDGFFPFYKKLSKTGAITIL